MAEVKLLYKICDGFDYSKLVSRYGFYKTSPEVKGNPWYQIFLETDWSSGFGFPMNGISINQNFGSIWLLKDESIARKHWQKIIDQMLEDGAIEEIAENEDQLTEQDFARIEDLSCHCKFVDDEGRRVANFWYRRGVSVEELAHALFPQYIW